MSEWAKLRYVRDIYKIYLAFLKQEKDVEVVLSPAFVLESVEVFKTARRDYNRFTKLITELRRPRQEDPKQWTFKALKEIDIGEAERKIRLARANALHLMIEASSIMESKIMEYRRRVALK